MTLIPLSLSTCIWHAARPPHMHTLTSCADSTHVFVCACVRGSRVYSSAVVAGPWQLRLCQKGVCTPLGCVQQCIRGPLVVVVVVWWQAPVYQQRLACEHVCCV